MKLSPFLVLWIAFCTDPRTLRGGFDKDTPFRTDCPKSFNYSTLWICRSPDTIGLINIQTHRHCNSTRRTSISSSQKKSQHWEGEVDTVLNQETIYNWCLLGKRKSTFSKECYWVYQPHFWAGPIPSHAQEQLPANKKGCNLLFLWTFCLLWIIFVLLVYLFIFLLRSCFWKEKKHETGWVDMWGGFR